MKEKMIITFLFVGINFCSIQSYAVADSLPNEIHSKTVYGDDDRMDIYQCTNPLLKEIAHSTAGQISVDKLIQIGEFYTIKAQTMAETGLCKEERFSNQLQATDCSGFLVAPDILVTAGHCISNISECSSYRWIFDYTNETEEKAQFVFNKDQIFHCTEILERTLELSGTKNDYAVLKLDRPVPGRVPLKYRSSGLIEDNAILAVIGHPSGMPTKITPNATVRKNSEKYYFVTNADTFGGNSGSPVVNAATGFVEGILVRGDRDYNKDPARNCDVVNRYAPDGGSGESATRIMSVSYLFLNPTVE